MAALFLLACSTQVAEDPTPDATARPEAESARGPGPEPGSAPQAPPISDRVDVGGLTLHFNCTGEGAPLVVLDTGISETYRTWDSFLREIARDNRVCGYDRAGYGESGVGPMPRSASQVARELATLLAEAEPMIGLGPPYVLVGHSLGALHSLVFAAEYPASVAGLVLVDPPPLRFLAGEVFPELSRMFATQAEEFRNVASESRANGEESAAFFFETLASEHEMLSGESLEAVAAISDLGDLPLIVISSGRPNPAFGSNAEPFQEFWIESSREVAGLSRRGRFILAEESGHHVHLDDPALLMGAIRELISGLRRGD